MVRQHNTPNLKEWVKCPACHSSNWVFAIRDKGYRCRKCGNLFDADVKTYTCKSRVIQK